MIRVEDSVNLRGCITKQPKDNENSVQEKLLLGEGKEKRYGQ